MNELIVSLFQDLNDADPTVYGTAIAKLGYALEKHFEPNRNEQIWALVLPEELFALRLSPEEGDTILNHAFDILTSNKLAWACSISLAQSMGLYAGGRHLRPMLSFLALNAPQMSEQELFSFLATLGTMMQRLVASGEVGLLKNEIEKNQTAALLKEFTQSARLRESVTRLLHFLESNCS